MIVYLNCSDNNRSLTVYKAFLKAVELYGLPSRVRSDQGRENILVAQHMLETKGDYRYNKISKRKERLDYSSQFLTQISYYSCTQKLSSFVSLHTQSRTCKHNFKKGKEKLSSFIHYCIKISCMCWDPLPSLRSSTHCLHIQ